MAIDTKKGAMLSPLLSESDIRSIIAILSQVAAEAGKGGDHLNCKRLMLSLLSELVGADKWIWALRSQGEGDDIPIFAGLLHEGFTDEELGFISAAAADPSMRFVDNAHLEELVEKQTHITRRLEDLDTEKLWSGSNSAALAAQAGVGTFITSARPMDGIHACSSIALYRPPGSPTFTDRERHLAHLVLTEVGWLHALGWPEEKNITDLSALPPSQLPLLNLLLRGRQRQAISETLGLSLHTINSYTKNIFAHFKVNSQTQLMGLFVFGEI